MSEEEIKRMQREAEEHKGEDEKRKQVVNAPQHARWFDLLNRENCKKKAGDKVPAEEKSNVEAALTEARKFSASTDLAEIEKATEALTTAS